MKVCFVVFISLLFIACGDDAPEHGSKDAASIIEPAATSITPPDTIAKLQKPTLQHFSEKNIARYTMAVIMGQSPKIIKATKENDYYKVWYKRPDDRKLFEYRVKIDGNFLLWASYTGRWRNDPADEIISFVEDGKQIRISQKFSDGSGDTQTFKLGE